jgi:hypothetical protein
MWRCPSCGEQIDDNLDACANCGTVQDTTRDVEQPAASGLHERVVEVCSAANIVEANDLYELLDEAGIKSQIVGDSLGAAAGCLPLGEATAPRIWVRESDADRARQIIEQWHDEISSKPAALPEDEDSPDIESPNDCDEAPLPSDVRFHFLHQGFFLAGFASVVVGAVWAWQNSVKLAEYSATARGRYAGSERGSFKITGVPHDRNLPLQPFVNTRSAYTPSTRVTYAYTVAGKTYRASKDFDEEDERPRQMLIHYNPRYPAENFVGPIAPPWVVLVFAFGIAAFLSFVGFQFR